MTAAREHHLEVRRTARYYTLGEPSGAVTEAWFVLHGHAQLAARFIRNFESIAAPHRLIVAPEALSRFYLGGASGRHGGDARIGATWMTREDRVAEIEDYVRYLDALYDHLTRGLGGAAVSVTGLGFSQGVSTLVRWACRGRARLGRLILWAGTFPPEIGPAECERFAGIEIVRVLGNEDQFAEAAILAADEKRFAELGLTAPLLRFQGGHAIDDATLSSLAR